MQIDHYLTPLSRLVTSPTLLDAIAAFASILERAPHIRFCAAARGPDQN
jgi:hypothetical protein